MYDSELKKYLGNFDYSLLEGSSVMITGATGLVGSAVVKSLLKHNENAEKKIEQEKIYILKT